MKTKAIGASELKVGCIGLGGMPLSISGRPDEATGIRVIHAALDSGMTLIDTADVYCLDNNDIGHNEKLIARALREWSGNSGAIVVATKGGLERPGGAWTINAHPDHLKAACHRSLAALGVECIDLYQLHAPDPSVPFADSIGALADLQKAGKVRHIGLSNVDVNYIEQAKTIVEVISVQNRCNPFDRSSFENGVISHCTRNNIAFLPYSPVGGGYGHFHVANDPTLRRIGERHGATPYQVCLAWLLSVSPVMIPIPGASRIASATSSAAAAELLLSDEDIAKLNNSFLV